jgi:trehalose 6-phosphate phosphatase
LFLDFDGVLAPLVEVPSRAQIAPETRHALIRLTEDPRFSVSILSGRALNDLVQRVGIANVTYVGNFGLEISGPHIRFIEPAAAQWIKALGELSRYIRARLRHIPGIQVENKVLTSSVHIRGVPTSKCDEVREVVCATGDAVATLFEVVPGRQAFEIRPRVNWHEGMAIRVIKQALSKSDSASIYLGADLTGEHIFSALPEGVTVGVGCSDESGARYFLDQQELVCEFLSWLSRTAGTVVARG